MFRFPGNSNREVLKCIVFLNLGIVQVVVFFFEEGGGGGGGKSPKYNLCKGKRGGGDLIGGIYKDIVLFLLAAILQLINLTAS